MSTVDPSPEVATLLAQSHAAHLNYRTAVVGHRVADAREALTEAARTRLAAHEADPNHQDPAWAGERLNQFHHDELVAFYRQQLNR